MEITTEQVRELRTKTGAGIVACKEALVEAKGELELAAEILRKKGIADAGKRSGRVAGEGVVAAYIHPGSKVGVLIEVNCETDFVARTDEFKALVNDLSLQVAAASPIAVRREEVPEGLIAKEKEILLEQAKAGGKPEKVIEKIVEGRMKKFYEEVCLLEQPFIKDQKKKVEDLIKETAGKLGENIVVRRFSRFAVGGD